MRRLPNLRFETRVGVWECRCNGANISVEVSKYRCNESPISWPLDSLNNIIRCQSHLKLETFNLKLLKMNTINYIFFLDSSNVYIQIFDIKPWTLDIGPWTVLKHLTKGSLPLSNHLHHLFGLGEPFEQAVHIRYCGSGAG